MNWGCRGGQDEHEHDPRGLYHDIARLSAGISSCGLG